MIRTMAKKKIDDVNLLLSRLDKQQLADFIRKECSYNRQLKDRFLALGAGTFFHPDYHSYADRVMALIEKYSGRNGYIYYRDTYDFNRDVSQILEEADEAMTKNQWEVAIAVLTGIASVAEDILNSGDDSDGELGAIVRNCFDKWHQLTADEALPDNSRFEIFDLALSRFKDEDLKEWGWWWNWMSIAVDLADTPEKQTMVFDALDAIKPDGNGWSSRHAFEIALKYKLEMISRYGSKEDQIKFLYDNGSNPDFRKELIQMAWDKADYDEVLRLSKDGVEHDSNCSRLVNQWNQWLYRVFCKTGDRDNELRLARHIFFNGSRYEEKEFSMQSMYAALKSLIPSAEWPEYVNTLISEAKSNQDIRRLLYIYCSERMWNEYMDYIRNSSSIDNIEDAPKEVKMLFRDEIVKLYSAGVNRFFQRASDRKSYRIGVSLLRGLIKHGGKEEADQIVAEQKSRLPRRPALIEELSKL